jgi:hypothetical protein
MVEYFVLVDARGCTFLEGVNTPSALRTDYYISAPGASLSLRRRKKRPFRARTILPK